MEYTPREELVAHETGHWRVSQRVDCPVPGYLMVGAKAGEGGELPDLPGAALGEVGGLLGRATRILRTDLGEERVYIGRYGHEVGYPAHFHVIPVYSWMVAAYHADPRYAVEGEPDGANLTLFIWREYCERPSPPPCPGPSVPEAIAMIGRRFGESEAKKTDGGDRA